MNKDLFIMARQTQRRNKAVFRAAPADLVMLSSYVVAAEVLRNLRAPLLSVFLRRARDEDEQWAGALLSRLRASVGEDVLESWTLQVTPLSLPAVCEALKRGEVVTLRRLLTRVDGSLDRMRAVPLLLVRGQERLLVPALDDYLAEGDQILFCGRALARTRMRGIALTRELAPPGSNEEAAQPAA